MLASTPGALWAVVTIGDSKDDVDNRTGINAWGCLGRFECKVWREFFFIVLYAVARGGADISVFEVSINEGESPIYWR